METKTCSKCGEVKDVEEFYANKNTKDGLHCQCKQCHREYNQANAEKIAEKIREYRQANAEKIAENIREYKQANAEKIAEKKREYKQANPEKVRIINSRRRARKNALPDTFTETDYDYLMREFGGQCVACGKEERIELDHYIPISKDTEYGTTPENIIPLCRSCNSSKHNKLPDEWLATFEPSDRKRIKDTITAYFKKVAAWQALPMFEYIREQS